MSSAQCRPSCNGSFTSNCALSLATLEYARVTDPGRACTRDLRHASLHPAAGARAAHRRVACLCPDSVLALHEAGRNGPAGAFLRLTQCSFDATAAPKRKTGEAENGRNLLWQLAIHQRLTLKRAPILQKQPCPKANFSLSLVLPFFSWQRQFSSAYVARP